MIHRLFSLLVLISLMPGAAQAQSNATTKAALVPRYDVEVIIFKNLKVPTSTEFVLPVSSPSKSENMLDLSSPASVAAARAEAGVDASKGRLIVLHAICTEPGAGPHDTRTA